eukprot:RCo015984
MRCTSASLDFGAAEAAFREMAPEGELPVEHLPDLLLACHPMATLALTRGDVLEALQRVRHRRFACSSTTFEPTVSLSEAMDVAQLLQEFPRNSASAVELLGEPRP